MTGIWNAHYCACAVLHKTKMADLGKSVSRLPKRFMNEPNEYIEEKPTTYFRKPKIDRNLYEIEVKEVDNEN